MDYNIISEISPQDPISETYRILRTNIEFSTIDKDVKLINITSSKPSEGKTLTLLNLATVYSHSSKRVLIVDLDLRRPKIHRAFKIDNTTGITDVIMGEVTLEDATYKHSKFLDVLTSGSKTPYPVEMLNSQKMKDLMEKLKDKYDIVFIDCPPLNILSDSIIISKFSEGTVVAIRNNITERKLIKKVLHTLEENNVNTIGTVLTDVKKKDLDYSSYSYY